MDKLVYLFYPAMLLVLLWGSKWYGRRQWNEEAFSLGQTKAWQGFFALLIMLHHVGQKTCASWLPQNWPRQPGLEPFVPFGYYYVGFFLVCSGYGLYKSWKNKPDYLRGFLKRSVLPLLLVYLIVDRVYLIVRLTQGVSMTNEQTIWYLIGAQQANPNAWYVLALPVFYVIFWLCFRLIRRETPALLLTTLGVLAWVLVGCATDHNDWWMRGEWWYNSAMFFPLGLWLARAEGKLIPHVKRLWWVYLLLAAVAVPGMHWVAEYARSAFGYYCEWVPELSGRILRRGVTALAEFGAALPFVAAVILLGMKVRIGNAALRLMSCVTLEFYLMHGLFVELFAFRCLDKLRPAYYVSNVFFYGLAVFVCGLVSALILRQIMGLFRQKARKDLPASP